MGLRKRKYHRWARNGSRQGGSEAGFAELCRESHHGFKLGVRWHVSPLAIQAAVLISLYSETCCRPRANRCRTSGIVALSQCNGSVRTADVGGPNFTLLLQAKRRMEWILGEKIELLIGQLADVFRQFLVGFPEVGEGKRDRK